MSWGTYRIAVVCAAVLASASCGESDSHPHVTLGTFLFSGTVDLKINSCTVANPTVEWTTTFTAQASTDLNHIWIVEQAYGCSFLVPLRGSIADGGGLSCSVSGAGFFQEDFFTFQWDFAKKQLKYTSVLTGQDVNKAATTYCATVQGSIVPE
jgi:hypothetical protein